MNYPPITVGVLTHNRSFVDFNSFLTELSPALECYPGRCQLVVVNNSGETAATDTRIAVSSTSISQHSDCMVVASAENNISMGRNIVFDNAEHDLIALIDDDEFPTPGWLTNLVDTLRSNACGIVAGPAYPLYLFDTPQWIRSLDLHNAMGKHTGDKIQICPTANVLIDKTRIAGSLFNTEYGRTGGEDSEFFLRQYDANVDMRWSNEAAVYEYIPEAKSTSRYMIKRCILQGTLNRRILTARGDIPSQPIFILRSTAIFGVSLLLGGALWLAGHQRSGRWLKRAFCNLGHFLSVKAELYPHA